MGKYKQWLHHQEVGRRLREQIATHEQERERVQRMAPSHPTTLPDTNNPLVRALLDYTGRGGTLGRAVGARPGAAVGASAGGSDADPHQRQPARLSDAAPSGAAPSTLAGISAPAQASRPPAATPNDNPIVAQLAAQAAQMPADPLAAMRALAQSQAAAAPQGPPATPVPPQAAPAPTPPPAPEADSAGEWWQRFRTQS